MCFAYSIANVVHFRQEFLHGAFVFAESIGVCIAEVACCYLAAIASVQMKVRNERLIAERRFGLPWISNVKSGDFIANRTQLWTFDSVQVPQMFS